MKTLRWSTLLPGLLVACLAWSPLACGGDDDDDSSANNGSGGSGTNGSGTGGSGTGPGANCSGRCATKATACMLPANLVDPYCQQLCATSPTEGQLACIEGKSCQELTQQDPLALCPGGGTGGSGTGGSGTGGSGTGGSGTGGSGTGGSGGGALPDSVTASGKRKPGNEPIHVLNSEQTEIASALSGGADITFSAEVGGQIDVQNAGTKEVTKPSAPTASDCPGVGKIGVTMDFDSFSYTFADVDVLPATACAEFADNAHEQGLTMRFTDVPIYNSSEKIKELIVEISP